MYLGVNVEGLEAYFLDSASGGEIRTLGDAR